MLAAQIKDDRLGFEVIIADPGPLSDLASKFIDQLRFILQLVVFHLKHRRRGDHIGNNAALWRTPLPIDLHLFGPAALKIDPLPRSTDLTVEIQHVEFALAPVGPIALFQNVDIALITILVFLFPSALELLLPERDQLLAHRSGDRHHLRLVGGLTLDADPAGAPHRHRAAARHTLGGLAGSPLQRTVRIERGGAAAPALLDHMG
jgi:hypothetical protein